MLKNKIIDFSFLKTVLQNRPVRIMLYICSSVFFVYVLLISLKVIFPKRLDLFDLRKFYFEKRYSAVVYYADRINLRKPSDKNKLLSLVILSDVKIFKDIKDVKFLYDAIDKSLKISNIQLHIRMLKNILSVIRKNPDIKSSLIYYYVQKTKHITKKIVSVLLQHIGNNKVYLNSLYGMIGKVKCKHEVLYKLSKILSAGGDYVKALKYLKIAKGITNDKRFLQRIDDFLILLNVRNKNCKSTLSMLKTVKSSIPRKKQYMYKFFCQDVLNTLDTKRLREFLNKYKIDDNDSELFLLSKYFSIKLLLEDKNYSEVIKNLISVLNTLNIVNSLVRKEDVLLYTIQKFYSRGISNSYRRWISTLLLRHYDKLDPYFLLGMFRAYIIPSNRIFSYTQKKNIYSKIIDVIRNNETEYLKFVDGLTSMYYVLTKAYYYLGDYQKAVSFANNYIKIKPLSDLEKIEIYRALVIAYSKLGDYKRVVDTADEVLSHYDSIYKIKMIFTKLKLEALKKVDRNAFEQGIEKNLKTPQVSFDNPYYKYFFREYLYILLDRIKNVRYTKGILAGVDKLIMYSAVYKEFYSEELKDINAEILKMVSSRSKLNNCLQLSYYYDAFASFVYVLFQNDMAEKLYKFAYCMLKKNKAGVVINLMQNVLSIDDLSNLDKFLVSSFLYLAYKKEKSQPRLTTKLLKSSKKMYKSLDEMSLSAFSDMPYNPRKMGKIIYGK